MINFKSFFIVLVAAFLSLNTSAKSVINVHFPLAKNHKAILWGYDDLISYRNIILTEKTIDKSNSFSFTLSNKDIIPVRIQVEFFRIDLYIEPNRNYEIEVDSVDFTVREFYPINIVGYLTPPYKILSPVNNEVNQQLENVNQCFANFYDTNYVYLYQNRLPKEVLNKFEKEMDSLTKLTQSDFVKMHINIQMTQLRMMIRQIGSQWVVDNFFNSGKVQYNNKIYMDFFNSFWSKYILVSLRGLRYGELDSVVNLGSYAALSRLLEKDPLLKNAQIRELVVLQNIIQLYSDYRFDKQAISDILSDISDKGITAENRKMAVNIRLQMLDFISNKAPEFTLFDFYGMKHSLSDFEGKYVYINFWNEECVKCIAEMDLTKELYLDYDDVIQFVSVYVGPDAAEAKQVIIENEYKWLQLDYNSNFELIRNYNVELFPYYILIDKIGKIEWIPAYTPSEGFSSYFVKMLNDKKGNLK